MPADDDRLHRPDDLARDALVTEIAQPRVQAVDERLAPGQPVHDRARLPDPGRRDRSQLDARPVADRDDLGDGDGWVIDDDRGGKGASSVDVRIRLAQRWSLDSS